METKLDQILIENTGQANANTHAFYYSLCKLYTRRESLKFVCLHLSFSLTAPCPVQTSNKGCCVFPFTYKGKTYHSCTKIGHHSPWCSLSANYDKKWGHCPGENTTHSLFHIKRFL